MKGFKETEIGLIPDEWEVLSIGDFFKLTSGKTRPKNTLPQKTEELNIPVYGGNGILGFSNTNLLSDTVLILGRVGEYCGCAHLTEKLCWITDNALYTKEIKKDCDLVFMRYCFEYLKLNQYSNKMGQPLITQGIIHNVKFAVPTIPEQTTIAHILSTIQQAIEKQQQLIDRTTELKKALMHKLFTEGTKGEKQKETEIGLVPESWEVDKIGNKCNVKSGGTPNRKEQTYWDNGTIPWVKTGEIKYKTILDTEEKITDSGLKNSSAKLFTKGTLLMAMYGQGVTRGKVGLLGIDATTNQACAAIMPNDRSLISSEYLHDYFEYTYDKLRDFGHGANQKNLSSAIIKTFQFPIPLIQEQSEIVAVCKSINNRIDNYTKKKTSLETLFKTMLHELMTGKTRVKDVNFTKEYELNETVNLAAEP